jgi:FKBP-type peptidyl-prolyl cis-trans isomerase
VKRCLAFSLLLALAGCGGGEDGGSPTGPTGEITIEELTVGTGALAVVGDIVTTHYTLFLANGTRLESSLDTGTPITFQTGVGAVIPGFDRGVLGMRVGGRRRVTIPPELAYGAAGRGPVPPNATLRFDIELVSIAGK